MLEEAGYEVETIEKTECIEVIAVGEDSKNDYVNVYYFESEELAEQYYDTLNDADSSERLIIGIDGSTVYVGTEEAVNAINGTWVL